MSSFEVSEAPSGETIIPLRLDPARLAGSGLLDLPVATSRSRGNPRRVLSGIGRQSASELFRGDIAVVVFESAPGKVELVDMLYDEFVFVLEGKAILTAGQGGAQEFEGGDSYVVPKGFTGTWEMVGEVFRELIVVETQTFLEDLGSP